jgi:hypothetical protein
MSEIPFVKALGDAAERALAADIVGRRGRIRRRIVIGGLSFAIAATGVAAASGVFTGTAEELATTSVGCYDRPGLSGGVSVISVADGTPVEACRRALRTSAPLVACADGPQLVVVHGRDCKALGLQPVPAGYTAARARVLAFQRAVVAIEGSSDCIAPDALAERVQRLLDESGWTGWRTKIRSDLGPGPCAAVTAFGGDGGRYLEGSLDPREKEVLILPQAHRSTLDLLYAPDRGVARELEDASGARCYTRESLETLVRRRLEPTGRAVTFTAYRGGGELGDARRERLADGCVVIAGLSPADDGLGIEVEVWAER